MTQRESARVQVEEVVRRIVAGFSPDRIVVFGSHARGEQTRESDLDLLVVMPVTGSRRKQAAAIELALVGVDMPTDVIVATPDEVARLQGVPGSIIKPALQEGRVVYERPA
jgi:predicted nucleotidyltransferase